MELNNGQLRLRCVPQIGGSIVEFAFRRGEEWISLMRDGEDPLTKSSNASSFVLIPYSNRLRDGRFIFSGIPYQLRHAEKHAIHGDVRDRPWAVHHLQKHRVELLFDSMNVPNLNFPFPFSAKLSYALALNSFDSWIEVVNTGPDPMPVGCGFHPYFRRRLPGSTSDVMLQFEVTGVYPGDSPLPTGGAVPLETFQNFSSRRILNVEMDHCFSGWTRHASIDWPGTGISARITAESGMEHLILYSPPGQDYFALEPVTHANDGFNLYAQGDENSGVRILKPGEHLATGMQIRIDCDGQPVSD